MKKVLFGLLLTCSFVAKAQVYNNEWIDYSKAYYKFKVGSDGVYRIPFSLLNSVGLGSTPAEQFQLWRNGVQVPIYTSAPTGTLSATGYIEFWGKMNDGKPDKQLYRKPTYQLNDKWNLITDTATYFLTVNTAVAENLRLESTANDVAGNTLPVEPYFMYTAGNYFKNKVNSGYAVPVGSNFYSSSYDYGEGWTSADIVSQALDSVRITYGTNTSSLTNLFVYNGGPSPTFKITISGNATNQRTYKLSLNGDTVISKQVNFYDFSTDSVTVPLAKILSNTASIAVTNFASVECYKDPIKGTICQTDRMVIHKYELTYPRLFDFGGAANFEFTLPASPVGNYLEITNFSSGTTVPPVLYDLTNGKRYVADMSVASKLRFVLLPSAGNRDLVLVREDASNVKTITEIQTRNFIDYRSTGPNVGDYLIISNPLLFNGVSGDNPVEDYRAYRSSAAGGSYSAKIYLADELIDQFGFGIKKNPLGLRNFIRYARLNYPVQPRHVFLIGKGVNYLEQRSNESSTNQTTKTNLAKLNLVPTFGWPASDILLAAEPGSSIPAVPIGRLSAISAQEVTDYLNKVKEFELTQVSSSPSSEDKKWMKNVVHIVGASDEDLGTTLSNSMNGFRKIITDTLFGANVTTFSKQSADGIQQLSSTTLTKLFNEGISLITYFGHSSASTLEFNLDNPENYNNQGKYPVFIGLGCNAGDFFTFNPARFITKETISEKYNLIPNRGTIGFIASTHFGIVQYLDIWNTHAYKRLSNTSYGGTLGEILKHTAEDVFLQQSQEDFYARATVEESELHGDPALTINPHPKADYVIEDPMVKVSPGFVSVADASFKMDAKFLNIGKAVDTRVVVEVKRQLPDQSVSIVKRDTIAGIRYIDSISVTIPIDPTYDKGLNKITITIDADNHVDEAYETNNSITKEVMIYEDEARTVYPYNFAIINEPIDTLIASTANPFSPVKQYQMELDTTEFFNSPFKVVKTITTAGGTMEFAPGVSFKDSTVYYWRVAPVPQSGPFHWNTASFVYLANSDVGFNQSHLFQHLKSDGQRIYLDSFTQKWTYKNRINNIFLRNGVYPTTSAQGGFYSGTINDMEGFINAGCNYDELIFNVIDPITFKAWKNDSSGLYQSNPGFCGPGRIHNFMYFLNTLQWRKKIMDFIDSIPDGNYVVVRSNSNPSVTGNTYSSIWKNDESVLGTGNSLYHKLFNQGLTEIDSFNSPRSFIFIFRKNQQSNFTPVQKFSIGVYDGIIADVNFVFADTSGIVSSPLFGPAKGWKQLKWRGESADFSDVVNLNVIGVNANGKEQELFKNLSIADQDFDLSSINASDYPYIKLKMYSQDSVNLTPYPLKYWRITYTPVPEGAVAPNQYFYMKDTVDVAEPLQVKIAFKNVGPVAFPDSIKVKAVVTDQNNISHTLPVWKQRALPGRDSLHVFYTVDTKQLVGSNAINVEVNPDNDQLEQHHFNNFFYKSFYVRPDTLNPSLDVTFDNVHILNHDIVSAKPDILIKLKDEAKWFLLNDTSTVNVQVRFPDGSLRAYNFDGATMQFIPAQKAPSTDNTATVNLKPSFDQDGDYELIVSAKDMSENKAGVVQYRVAFQVFNKPMISNMLNYPNPFTTSTAFVFTVTGSQVPQNIRIQILTVTGKIVREITKEELGPLRVGRNITEFKWDGTDQYGQKLANGIYLYRVVTNLNGKSLEKFTDANDDTDKYFNKGYGKMYLMR